jgi:hypothetical protein
MTYDVDYFINKFSKIPTRKWGTGQLDDHSGHKCVFGHCGVTTDAGSDRYGYNEEANELIALFKGTVGHSPIDINDGTFDESPLDCIFFTLKEHTPKARIMKTLRKIKKALEGRTK